jgi:hypothetical protein
MAKFDSLRDGMELVFEGGCIKDFYYDEYPDLAPTGKDLCSDGDFAACDALKNGEISVESYGKAVLKGVYS